MSDKLQELAGALDELKRRETENKLASYAPYEKQEAFHTMGATKRERLLMAGNQLGKTWAGGMEAAYHLTGIYPDWWEGRRFSGPVRAWAASVTSESTRDNVQRILLGTLGQHGTGAIPKDRIEKVVTGRGIPDACDNILVKHKSGGLSQIGFKSYERGREKWQGETLDFVWFDEEPDLDIYAEGLARISAKRGMIYMTFTPLLGMSDVVRRFLSESSPDRGVVTMTIDDAKHIPAEERARVIAGYPEWERDARVRGIPMLGSGRVFQIAEEMITETPIQHPPEHWSYVGGLDFGIDHPFAAVLLGWDRDCDCLHVMQAYRVQGQSALQHCAALKPWGSALPYAWPHDGHSRDKGSGQSLASQYKANGLTMLGTHATWPDGSSSVEAGILEMQERMETGRFKVARHLNEFFEEFRLYHRKDGMLVKKQDDLLSATRYAVMMKRYAKPLRDVGLYGHRRRQRQTMCRDIDFDCHSVGTSDDPRNV